MLVREDGRHTDEFLRSILYYSDKQLSDLKNKEVILWRILFWFMGHGTAAGAGNG
jgi:hypothetical protein